MSKVYNRHHKDAPEGAVYVGRPSKWGNPFKIGKDGTRAYVLAKYTNWLRARLNDPRDHFGNEVVVSLKGKDLVCWCSPEPCHADLLLELANTGVRKFLGKHDPEEIHNIPER